MLVAPLQAQEFEPAYTMQEVLERQRRVPSDDHWWAVTGDQMGWMHKNTQQLFPTVPVYRAGKVRELETAPLAAIADFPVETPGGTMRFEDFLVDDQSTALGVVVLHKGRVAFESYPRMRDYEKVTYWSVAKAIVGTAVYLLEARGEIDTREPIETYIPRLADSSFAGITVRNLLEHESGVDCSENYEDPKSCYYQYSMAIGDNRRDDTAPDNPYDFLAGANFGRIFEPGARFDYSGVNNFLLSWLIQEVTGYPLQDVVTREFWSQIGAENDAAYIAYRYGIALSHGGFISRMRDLARFGLLFTPSYVVVSDRRVVPIGFLDALFRDHSPNPAWPLPDGSYSHMAYQWSIEPERGVISHGGWGGQGLIIDARSDVVVVFTSYVKEDDSEVDLEPVIRAMLRAVFPALSETAE